ncbi:MAG: hypothetical protein ACRDVM_04970 [Acidimicrobiia bacterium]
MRFRTILLCVALATVACVTGSASTGNLPSSTLATGPPGTPSTTASADPVDRFAACLQDRGLEVPRLAVDASGHPLLADLADRVDLSSPAVAEAMAACSPILVEADLLDLAGDPDLQAVVGAGLARFAACMRRQGIESFPDPIPGFLGTGSPFPRTSIPFEAPGFQEAAAACRRELAGSISGG